MQTPINPASRCSAVMMFLTLIAVTVFSVNGFTQVPFSATKVSPTPELLWNYILNPPEGEGKNYTQWQFFPEPGITYPAALKEEPHGRYVAVYVNPIAYESLTNYLKDTNPGSAIDMKTGSVIIKENYGAEKPDLSKPVDQRDGLLSRTVMWKVDGYTSGGGETRIIKPEAPNPSRFTYLAGGEWFYAMYTGQGAQPDQPVVTINQQAFLAGNPRAFGSFVGETQAGKPWFCISCHQEAIGPTSPYNNSYGDYIWMLSPFKAE